MHGGSRGVRRGAAVRQRPVHRLHGSGLGFGTGTGGSSNGRRAGETVVYRVRLPVPFEGRMENCRWERGRFCAARARIYGSTFAGTLDLGNTCGRRDAVAGQGHLNAANNVFGATNAAAMNIADPDVE